MIYVGTSGYSYEDWIGPFYREGIQKGGMLEEYSKAFKFTEVNSTYYSMPNKYMFFNLAKKTPEGFKFTVKLHGSMTHTRDAGEGAYEAFMEALKPLEECGKLGCLVAQFPYSFHYDEKNMDYIKNMREHIMDLPLCVEFRNNRWMDGETYRMLASQNIGFICVDEPDIKGLLKQTSIVTSKVGYVRFHGRNVEKWYEHKESYERYNYLYSGETLSEWVPRIRFIEENTDFAFIAFNNHFKAQGAVNASMLQRLLDARI